MYTYSYISVHGICVLRVLSVYMHAFACDIVHGIKWSHARTHSRRRRRRRRRRQRAHTALLFLIYIHNGIDARIISLLYYFIMTFGGYVCVVLFGLRFSQSSFSPFNHWHSCAVFTIIIIMHMICGSNIVECERVCVCVWCAYCRIAYDRIECWIFD